MVGRLASLASAVLALGLARAVDAQCAAAFTIAPDDSATDDDVGQSVAMEGATVVVGAPGGDGVMADSGVAYLYDARTEEMLARLLAPDGATLDRFGAAVAISNGLVLVGAPEENERGAGAGSAYLFDAATGAPLSKVLASDGTTGDRFGTSVAMERSIAVIGAPGDHFNGGNQTGSAYLFDLSDPAHPVELSKFWCTDGDGWFGQALAISRSRVIGAMGPPWSYEMSGCLFDISSPSEPVELATFDLSNDFYFWNRLGVWVAISGETAAVGTYAYDYGDGRGSTVSLFDSTTGEQTGTIRPPADAGNDIFGLGVAMSGDTLAVVSLPECDAAKKTVYIYDVSDPATPVALGWFSDPDCGIYFPVALSGPRAVAGGPWENGNQPASGKAYVFDLGACGMCPADWNDDGSIDTLDVLGFLNAWRAGDAAADFNRDGAIDTRDVVAFLGFWASGC